MYATLDDLAQWVDDDLPTTSPATLRSAAYMVREFTAAAVYPTDPVTHLPLDSWVADGFRDATCAQAAWLIANDISPFEGGGSAVVEEVVGIGSAKVQYADAADAAAARARGMNTLCPEAKRIISQLGLRTLIFESPYWRRPVWGDAV